MNTRQTFGQALTYALLILAPILGTTALVNGCHRTLQPGGAYYPGTTTTVVNPDGTTTTNFVAISAPDMAFFAVDSSYKLAYSIVDAAFMFEKDNRDALWKLTPSIKHKLDEIRPAAWDANVRYLRARAVYKTTPIPANLSTLQTILTEIQNLSGAATAAIAPAKTK